MFLENSWRYIKGYINLKIEGYFVERFLNLCMNRKIELWDIKKISEAEVIVKIKFLDVNKVKEIANITKCKITINTKKGVPDLLTRYKKRKIFLIIFLIANIFIKFCSERIWQIEIIGDFNIPIEELKKELEIENVKIGMKKEKLDYAKIKNNIYLRRNDIVWLGFDVKGSKAYVEFVQRNNKNEDDIKNEPCNIVAEKEGVIHKIIVKEGQKLVNEGDFVIKGQVLISGNVLNAKGESRLIHSKGEIIIKTWYTNKVTIPYEKDLVNKTGNKEKKYKLEIGNCKINLINSSTKYEKYDTITVSNKLKLFNKFELPIKLTELTYEEIEIDKVKYTKSQAENIAKIEVTNALNKLLPSKNKGILEKKYKIEEKDKSVTVEVTVECLEQIGIKELINR